MLAACGGGGAEDASALATSAQDQPDTAVAATRPATTPAAAPADAARVAAATATANSSVNACNPVRPFYWELGNAKGAQASGSVASSTSKLTYQAGTPMAVASASKWVYGAYVVERRNGQPSATDRKHLQMKSGYISLVNCQRGQTVDGCLAMGNNGDHTSAADGRFYYDGGHMLKHASLIGLGAKDGAGLAAEFRARLGSDIGITMNQPLPEGGMVMTPASYATFLRKLLSGSLKLGSLLGSQAACAAPRACGAQQAIAAPIQDDEVFHYTLGHWIEDDPVQGDGAFSSAGGFGFYPWIDAGKKGYGIVARSDQQSHHAGWASMMCGRLIRKAWATGVAQ